MQITLCVELATRNQTLVSKHLPLEKMGCVCCHGICIMLQSTTFTFDQEWQLLLDQCLASCRYSLN